MKRITLIIDFDSTFVKGETLEELATFALKGKKNASAVIRKLRTITRLGMEGLIPFEESLFQRLRLLKIHKRHIKAYIPFLKTQVSRSIAVHKSFFRDYSDRIFILSGGFIDYIWPVIEDYGISSSHIRANRFRFDRNGFVTGVDTSIPLWKNGGKVEEVRRLKVRGALYVIGDGYTDYEIKKAGLATRFYAFVENVRRESTARCADRIIHRFDEIVYDLSL